LIGAVIWWQSVGKYTRVPQIGGLVAATASTELRNVGLQVKNGAEAFDNRVAKGDVISTVPAMGSRVAKGSVVTVTVSKGAHLITVPQVTGDMLGDARTALRQAGLVPGTVSNDPSWHRDQHESGLRRLLAAAQSGRARRQRGSPGSQLRRPAAAGRRAVGTAERRLAERGTGRQQQPAPGDCHQAVPGTWRGLYPRPSNNHQHLVRPADDRHTQCGPDERG